MASVTQWLADASGKWNQKWQGTDGAAHVLIAEDDTAPLSVGAISGAATTILYNAAVGVRIDTLLGVAAGDVLRIHCSTDASLGWGSTETGAGTGAEDNAALPGSGAAGNGMFFAAGTELIKVPASLAGGQIWIALDGQPAAGVANIMLMGAG